MNTDAKSFTYKNGIRCCRYQTHEQNSARHGRNLIKDVPLHDNAGPFCILVDATHT